jgi:hypothetical protein
MLGLANKSEVGIENPNERSDAQTKTGEAKTGEISRPLPGCVSLDDSLLTNPGQLKNSLNAS